MTSKEVRKQFLDFFKNKEHKIVPSAPVVPYDDPTLLFTNAGMNQFKDIFLGKGTRDYKRAVDTQKCIRVSGKHNDLEEVGRDTYHHTFFEMLGNWSFGDYYKQEAITWAWELLTEIWKLPKERLWATVYRTDDEAFEIWNSQTDINSKHILRFDEKDNFWEMGETGPCGPCSEIHINIGDDYDNPKFVNADDPQCIEIWNLVFIQHNRDADGTMHDLPQKHIDTGMGFERICAVLQGKNSNYDTDIFQPIISVISKLSKIDYDTEENQVPMRVISDHVRTLIFAIADGAVPGNEGRGYVLRRILRRAARYGRKLNLNEPFLYKLVDTVINEAGGGMGEIFPEIKSNRATIKKIIKAEEESFNVTLDRGIEKFNEEIVLNLSLEADKTTKYRISQTRDKITNNIILNVYERTDEQEKEFIKIVNQEGWLEGPVLSGELKFKCKIDEWKPNYTKEIFGKELIINGEDVFKLYDTFGFPVDLTNVMAQEKGFRIDEDKFNELMNEQKERARKSTKDKLASVNVTTDIIDDLKPESSKPTDFIGYDQLEAEAKIIGSKKTDNSELVLLDKTPFYVEAGGQIDDLGKLVIEGKQVNVLDVTKINNQVVHVLEPVENLEIHNGEKILAKVDKKRRWDIMRNHSATHFLHAALRRILGTHVHQAGSYVGPDRLRFDFAHFKKLSEEEIRDIETLVIEKLLENIDLIHHRNIPFEEAKKMGALMFFGDKYGDKVNVVQFGDFSMEFCGGTHVKNSSQIGLFKIISESSIASGVRRIEAVTGKGIEKFIHEQELEIQNSELRIKKILEEKKKIEKELAEYKLKDKFSRIDKIVSNPAEVKGINIYKGKVSAENMDELKAQGDELRNKIKSGIGILISDVSGKVGIVCVVSDDLIKGKKLMAGKIVGTLAKIVGGGGGGRPHLATAGGKDITKIDEAMNRVEEVVGEFI